jgi:hypothetical protein
MPTRARTNYLPTMSAPDAPPGALGTGEGLPNAQPAANSVSGDDLDSNVDGSAHQGGAGSARADGDAPLPLGAIAANPNALVNASASLPKDALRLLKFKGDSDVDTLEDFLFHLELYFEALPGTYDLSGNPSALRHRLFVISGCFPPASVAAVWFRAHYTSDKFTSYAAFRNAFIGQFACHAASIVRLQDRWESAAQRRNQTAQEYYAYLLQLQSRIASVDWQQRPADHTLLTKFCSSARIDLRRLLQEKRIDHPDYTISQLVQAASVRESTNRAPVPSMNAIDGQKPKPGPTKKYCSFCKKEGHNADECRKKCREKETWGVARAPSPTEAVVVFVTTPCLLVDPIG